MKNFIIKSITIGLILYSIHFESLIILNHFYGQPSGHFSPLGWFVYGLIFALWGYILISGVYISLSVNDIKRMPRYYKGTMVAIVGYFLSRIPDVIDSVFLNNFSWIEVIGFVFLIPVLVEIEFKLRLERKKEPN